MIYAYDDEDNAPMWDDLPLPYQVRTWDEMIRAWEGEHNWQDLDGGKTGGSQRSR